MIRQSKAFLIMMDNYDRVLETTSLAYNSAGSSAKEFARWQESLEGRTNELKSAIEQFASETIDNKFVKSIISATTEVVKFGTEVGGAIPIITSLGIAFLAFQKEGLVNLFFTKVITQMKILTTTTIGAVGAVTTLQMVLGVGLAIGGILAVSYAINAMSEKAEKAREAVSILSNELSDMQENSKTVEQLSKRFDELRKKNTLSNVEQQEFLDIQNQLRELLPEINGYFDIHGNFIISEKENLQSLNKEYREYIALKRQELADASRESALYTIRDYETEKGRVELLKEYLKYAKKDIEGTLQASDLQQVTFLQSYLGLNFDKATIDKALRESKDNIIQSVSDMQNDIRNQIMNTSEWNKLSEDTQDAILKALSEVSEIGLPKLSEAITKGDTSAQEFIDTISKTDAFKDFKKQLENAKGSTDEFSESIETLESKLGNLSSVRSNIESLTNVLSNLDSGKFTASDMEALLSVSEEFLPYLNDEIALREKLNEVITESKLTYKATYEYIVLLSSDTYRTLTNRIEDYFNDLGIAYKDDLKNYKDLEKAKATISSNLIRQLAKKWGDYFSVGIGGELIVDDSKANISTRVLEKQAKEAQSYVDGFYKIFDDIQIDPIDIDFDTSSLKSSTDKVLSEIDRLKQELDRILQDKDFEISLLDFSGGEDFIRKQIEIYRQMQEKVHELAQMYRAMGLSENDDYIQQLRTQWMDYANSIAELESISFNNSNKAIDRTITQLELEQQLLKENSQEYIDIENKKYNEIVKREQLLQAEIARLQTIGTNSAKQQAEELIDLYYDTVSQRYSIIANLQSAQISIYEEQIDSLEKQKSAMEDLHKFTMQMIKDELNAKKKSIQDEIKGIEKVFNAKKQALRDEQDNRDYEKGLTEKSSVVADLENQLAIIKNDETAIAKRKQLEEELAKAKEDLADYQYKHSIDLAEKALDDQLKIEKDKLQQEVDLLDDTLSNEVKMRELANKRIEKSGEKLKNQLIKHAKEYTSFTEEEVTNAWEIAGDAVDDFDTKQQNLLTTLKSLTAELEKIQSMDTKTYAKNSGLPAKTVEQTKSEMKVNSAKWLEASKNNDTEKMKQMAEANQKLGKAMGWYYDSSTGIWYFDKNKKQRIYHEGGIVGGLNYATKSTEELAKLLKGELVITPPQADKVMDMITNNSNSNINISMPIVIEGNADSDTVKSLEKQVGKIADTVIEKLNTARTNTGFKKKPKFV